MPAVRVENCQRFSLLLQAALASVGGSAAGSAGGQSRVQVIVPPRRAGADVPIQSIDSLVLGLFLRTRSNEIDNLDDQIQGIVRLPVGLVQTEGGHGQLGSGVRFWELGT